MSHSIEVSTGIQKKYSVQVGKDLWDDFRKFCSQRYSSGRVFIIIDEQVRELHGESIVSGCRNVFDTCTVLPIPQGEKSKSVDMWGKLVDQMLAEGVERNTPVVVAGGGVTGDLGGFAAASVMRGVPLIHLPTTLLAMVDSSIGGKTGVNHQSGKNLVGAFYQPDAVFADTELLATLDEREWINGLAEIIKYAAIRNPGMFDRIRNLVSEDGFVPSGKWSDLIAESVQIKVDIVQEDTLETGKRAFLNFGHTFGHALEKNAGFGTISHGEAVFVGMLAACYASQQLGANINCARFDPFLPLYQIELTDSAVSRDRLTELMARDKKVKDETIRLVLLEDWGQPVLKACEDIKLLHDAWGFAFDKIK